MVEFLDGNEAVALGAIKAGCNFFAGYPITPATSILLKMFDELPKRKGLVIETEDEISAIGMCIGAAMSGKKVLTATSGPGISLYSENIGLAIMGEVPLVIVDCQRLGPATGSATKTSQGDIQFIRWGTSGGINIVALCPSNVEECYFLTLKAFNLSEKYRCPVFIMLSKEISLTKERVNLGKFNSEKIINRKYAKKQIDFKSCDFKKLSDISYFSDIGGRNIVHFTTSSHDENGRLTKDSKKIARFEKHLEKKIPINNFNFFEYVFDRQKGAKDLIISYGDTTKSSKDVIKLVRNRHNKKLSHLMLKTIWPIPEKIIRNASKGISKIYIPELNQGQYYHSIKELLPNKKIIPINKFNGELLSPNEIIQYMTK